jgi:hypothetical protein
MLKVKYTIVSRGAGGRENVLTSCDSMDRAVRLAALYANNPDLIETVDAVRVMVYDSYNTVVVDYETSENLVDEA